MAENAKHLKKTLRLKPADQEALGRLKSHTGLATEAQSVILAIHFYPQIVEANKRHQLLLHQTEKKLADLQRAVCAVQLSYIDLTLMVIGNESEEEE